MSTAGEGVSGLLVEVMATKILMLWMIKTNGTHFPLMAPVEQAQLLLVLQQTFKELQ
jgi:hypothetical protein